MLICKIVTITVKRGQVANENIQFLPEAKPASRYCPRLAGWWRVRVRNFNLTAKILELSAANFLI